MIDITVTTFLVGNAWLFQPPLHVFQQHTSQFTRLVPTHVQIYVWEVVDPLDLLAMLVQQLPCRLRKGCIAYTAEMYLE